MEITTITISKELKEKLQEVGFFREKYEDVIRRLLNEYNKIK